MKMVWVHVDLQELLRALLQKQGQGDASGETAGAGGPMQPPGGQAGPDHSDAHQPVPKAWFLKQRDHDREGEDGRRERSRRGRSSRARSRSREREGGSRRERKERLKGVLRQLLFAGERGRRRHNGSGGEGSSSEADRLAPDVARLVRALKQLRGQPQGAPGGDGLSWSMNSGQPPSLEQMRELRRRFAAAAAVHHGEWAMPWCMCI